MIIKVAKLRNFGVFHDFSWSSDIPKFKKFNLIYGWNRSGKTTLSRVFSACEKKSIEFQQYPENGEFEIKTDKGFSIKNSNIGSCNLPVKVFNKDFINENISFDPSNPCNPIVYVSEEDIKNKKRLEALKQDNGELVGDFENAQKEKIKFETAEEKFRIATAQNIKTTVGNLKIRDKYYDYDKSNLKTVLDNIGIDNFVKLSDKDFDKYKTIINSEAKQKQDVFPEYKLNFFFNNKNILSFSDIYSALEQLLAKKVISKTLTRLKDDKDLNNWVKHGFDLHKDKQETEKCLFCQKSLDNDFLDALSKHFSKDYENLQESIAMFTKELENLKKEKVVGRTNSLYLDLQDDYQEKVKKINDLVDELNEWRDKAIERLQEKFKNPLVFMDPPEKPKNFKIHYNKIIDDLRTIIINHNAKIDNHDEEVKEKKEKLKHHLIAIAIDKQNYKQIGQELEDSIKAKKTAKAKLNTNNKEIKVLERKTSNIGKAIQKINEHLEKFFGRKEIQLELNNDQKGYIIKRNSQGATNLSESEKTAIAFSYFIVKVHERSFKIEEGIIFIDDPVSSFDSNFIYHCFSLVKNHFKDAGQLFIATHNFQFFNLIKEWLLRKNKKNEVCEFHMIENIVKDDKRCAFIKQLEKTLKKFKSEYHFLFARLNLFIKEDSLEYADFYIIGNIARRFLEIFTNFKIPTTGDLFSKIGQLDTDTVSSTEKDKVYKLIQEFSHGSDPISAIEHKDKSESKEAIKILLKIVKESDKKHFNALKKSLPVT